jgi:hypothetical protein
VVCRAKYAMATLHGVDFENKKPLVPSGKSRLRLSRPPMRSCVYELTWGPRYDMDLAAHRIVTCLPLTELWTCEGPLDARPAERAGATEIEHLLRDGSRFTLADAGKPLRWILAADRFSFWKAEVKCRLVAPEADRFRSRRLS